MAEQNRDRVRAAKLRAKDPSKLTQEQSEWLASYEARTAMVKAQKQRALPSGATHAPTAAPRPSSGTLPPREQLSWTEPSAPSAHVQETVPPEGNITPEQHTWTPTAPPAVEGAEPPPPGAPPPAAEGTPLVDAAPAGAPEGDPVAAAQFAAFCVFLTGIGISSALELTEDAAIPPQIRAIMESETTHAGVLQQVSAAAQRVAAKYGFKSIPAADEAIVVGACGGSVLAYIALQKKKRKQQQRAVENGAPVEVAQPAPAPTADAPSTSMPPHLARLFTGAPGGES